MEIIYSYLQEGVMYRVNQISYNGVSVIFNYTSREDDLLIFRAGQRMNETHLLSSIRVLFKGVTLGEYSLKYSSRNNISLLTNISYFSDGQSYNPLTFFYGEGISSSDSYYKISRAQLQ